MRTAEDEFDRQRAAFQSLSLDPPLRWQVLDPLLAPLREIAVSRDERDWLVVLPRQFVRMEHVITQLSLANGTKTGIFDRNFEDPDRYHPVDDAVPLDRPYLLTGFEPGHQYRNAPPQQAVADIAARGRLPLTIEEGLAVFLRDPETLQRNACWSLAGSTRGDRRVPALWISDNAPKLGWCFAGAPHTWLGTASAADRITG